MMSLSTQEISHSRSASFNHTVHGARGAFALMVFVFHVVNSGLATLPILETSTMQFLLRTNEYGVELFFCVSGYVISGTLRRARSPAAFIEDRAIRIFPALWTSIIVIVCIGLPTGLGKLDGVDLHTLIWLLPANLLALPGVLPIHLLHPAAWSLSYELCFYAICAGLWSLRRSMGNVAVWLALPVAAMLLAFYPRALFLISGILVAEGLLDRGWIKTLARAPFLFLLAFLLAWHEIQMLTPTNITLTTLFDWSSDKRLPLAILGFACATIGFAGVVAGNGAFGWLLRTRILQYLGTISYSFYIWHPVVMSGVKSGLRHFGLAAAAGNGAQALFFVTALPPALLVAQISQRLLERRTGKWLRQRLHHPPSLQAVALAADERSLQADGTGFRVHGFD